MVSIELTLRLASSIGDVAAEAWDACANPADGTGLAPTDARPACTNGGGGAGQLSTAIPEASTSRSQYNPFISHGFLSSLEESGSVRARAGWQPMHLLAEEKNGRLMGAVPCYVKSHSRGEYVFDHGWAEAYERAGGSYYPKLLVEHVFAARMGFHVA